MEDLVILCADSQAQQLFEGLLDRPHSLGIRPITYKLLVHPKKDPGCYNNPLSILSGLADAFDFAIVCFDRAFSGGHHIDRTTLEARVEEALSTSPWADRCSAIVIDPELEQWLFTWNVHFCEAVGWKASTQELRAHLEQKGHLEIGHDKPKDPKAVVEEILRVKHRPLSGSVHRKIAEKSSIGRCVDPSFRKLLQCLRRWFPEA